MSNSNLEIFFKLQEALGLVKKQILQDYGADYSLMALNVIDCRDFVWEELETHQICVKCDDGKKVYYYDVDNFFEKEDGNILTAGRYEPFDNSEIFIILIDRKNQVRK